MDVPRHLYPFEHHFFERDGLRQHYLDEGAGEPVVMLHGNPTWSFHYRDLVRALAGQCRAVVPDHIGCGFSDKPGDDRYPYRLARRVDDLEALLDHLGLVADLTLVLHDWGGMIGIGYALRHPERVRRLVVLNTAACRLPPGKRLPWQLWLVRNTALGALLVRGFNAFARGATRVSCTRVRLSREVRDAYCAPYSSWHDRIATLRFVQDIPLGPADPGYDLLVEAERRLPELRRCPTLVCWGMRDFVFDQTFLEGWCEQLPQAEVHRFPDCGHWVLEDAGDEIAELVRRFLRDHPL